MLSWENRTATAQTTLNVPLLTSPSSSRPPTPRAAVEEEAKSTEDAAPVDDASYSADAPELFDEHFDTPMTNQEYEDYINQAGPHLMEEMPEGQLMEAMPEGLLQPPGSPWQDQSALEPDRDEHQQMLYASYSAPLYTQCPPLQPPRMLHKRELTRVPKPCQNSRLPPWIAMKSSCAPNRAASKRSKASRTKSKDAGAQLRGLRGAYLGYHSKEQAKIPLMASQLDVAAVNQQCEDRINGRLDQLVSLNRQLHHHMDSFWRRKRQWTRRGGKRRKAAAPESAVGDFDLPRAQVSSEMRNMYRANAKLVPPLSSYCDMTSGTALFVAQPYGTMGSDDESSGHDDAAELLDSESRGNEVAEQIDLATVELMEPSALRLKIHNMSSEMSGILKQAKAMVPANN